MSVLCWSVRPDLESWLLAVESERAVNRMRCDAAWWGLHRHGGSTCINTLLDEFSTFCPPPEHTHTHTVWHSSPLRCHWRQNTHIDQADVSNPQPPALWGWERDTHTHPNLHIYTTSHSRKVNTWLNQKKALVIVGLFPFIIPEDYHVLCMYGCVCSVMCMHRLVYICGSVIIEFISNLDNMLQRQ